MNVKIMTCGGDVIRYPKDNILENKENKSISQLLVTKGTFSKDCSASWDTPRKTFTNVHNNDVLPLNEVQQHNIGQRHVESSLKNDSNYENINIIIPVSIPELNRNHSIPTLAQHNAKICVIDNCIALSKKYIAESNYDLAREEVKKVINSPDCSNLQKIELVICFSYSCSTLKDCLDMQEAMQSVLPECNHFQKIVLFNNLSFIRRTLKDYKGAREAALLGLAFAKCTSTERIFLLHNLALAYKGLNDSCGQLQALHNALIHPKCNSIQQFTTLFSLSIVYSAINDEDASRQYLQAALNLKRCNTALKIHILIFLYKEWTALSDNTGAQQALLIALAIASAYKKIKMDLVIELDNLCSAFKEDNLQIAKDERSFIPENDFVNRSFC